MFLYTRRRRRNTSESASAVYLAFTTQPGTGGASPYTVNPKPVVAAKKSKGTTDTAKVGTVTLALVVLSGSPVLSGTTTKALSSGVADFSANGLTVTGAGTWYLTASLSGLTGATSVTGTTTSGGGGTTFTNAIHITSGAQGAIAAAHASYNDLPQLTVAILMNHNGTTGQFVSKGTATSGWFGTVASDTLLDFNGWRVTTLDFKRDAFPASGSYQWVFLGYNRATNTLTRADGPKGGTITDRHRDVAGGGAGANIAEGGAFWIGSDGGNTGAVMDVQFVGVASSILSLANMQAIADDAVGSAALFVDYWKPTSTGGSGTSIASGKSVLPALVTSGATVI